MARFISTTDKAEAKSRLVGIRLAMLTLRLRDNWIRLFGDHQTALIALAIVVIVSERLTRAELEPEFETLAVRMPTTELAQCNVSCIAAATGLNRETTRRKVEKLVCMGLLVRENGAVRLAPGFVQQDLAGDVVRTQLEEIRRAVNDLIRMGALEFGQPT